MTYSSWHLYSSLELKLGWVEIRMSGRNRDDLEENNVAFEMDRCSKFECRAALKKTNNNNNSFIKSDTV